MMWATFIFVSCIGICQVFIIMFLQGTINVEFAFSNEFLKFLFFVLIFLYIRVEGNLNYMVKSRIPALAKVSSELLNGKVLSHKIEELTNDCDHLRTMLRAKEQEIAELERSDQIIYGFLRKSCGLHSTHHVFCLFCLWRLNFSEEWFSFRLAVWFPSYSHIPVVFSLDLIDFPPLPFMVN